MIIVRSPLRITLGGGGTDLPSYYTEHEGFAIAAAIDKYVYVTINQPFTQGIYLKYSSLEHVETPSQIKHPIIREVLKLEHLRTSRIEITTMADIPAGTGLGSSGSFATALLKGLYTYNRQLIAPQLLAELACYIEIDCLKEPVGKQDQYIAAYGGITCFRFHKNHEVAVSPLKISRDTMLELEDNLLLFFTGYSRSASSILQDQHTRSQQKDSVVQANLDWIKTLGEKSQQLLESGQVDEWGALMHEHWEYKKSRSKGITHPNIDVWYEHARKNGALGGKLVGAGGGGFLMFYAKDRTQLRRAMSSTGLEEVRFHFDFEGTKVILS